MKMLWKRYVSETTYHHGYGRFVGRCAGLSGTLPSYPGGRTGARRHGITSRPLGPSYGTKSGERYFGRCGGRIMNCVIGLSGGRS
jgi:hypothetical protein